METKPDVLALIHGTGYAKHTIDELIRDDNCSLLVEQVNKFTSLCYQAIFTQYNTVIANKGDYVYTYEDVKDLVMPYIYTRLVYTSKSIDDIIYLLKKYDTIATKNSQDLDKMLRSLLSITALILSDSNGYANNISITKAIKDF